MSAHAVITAPAASLTKPVSTSLATGLGKTARRLSTAPTALPIAIRQGKSYKDTGYGEPPLEASLRTVNFNILNILPWNPRGLRENWEELSLLLRRQQPVYVYVRPPILHPGVTLVFTLLMIARKAIMVEQQFL